MDIVVTDLRPIITPDRQEAIERLGWAQLEYTAAHARIPSDMVCFNPDDETVVLHPNIDYEDAFAEFGEAFTKSGFVTLPVQHLNALADKYEKKLEGIVRRG